MNNKNTVVLIAGKTLYLQCGVDGFGYPHFKRFYYYVN